jgi:hypothetical protein
MTRVLSVEKATMHACARISNSNKQAAHMVFVALQHSNKPPVAHVPHARRLITAAGD